MLAGLDLASGQLFYRLRDRKRWQEFLAFLRQLRRRFPTGRLYIVCDNFSPHRKAEVAAWCAGHNVELVFTPTNASWLNWIECEFTALRYCTLDGSDYPSHTAQESAIAGYVRWANKHARPKRHFARSPRSAARITYRRLPDGAIAPRAGRAPPGGLPQGRPKAEHGALGCDGIGGRPRATARSGCARSTGWHSQSAVGELGPPRNPYISTVEVGKRRSAT
jgi:transposase